MSAVVTARFAGKVFAVTGGGAGIGEATVKKLSEGGASVVVADVDDAGGNRVKQEVIAAGGQAAFVHADITKEWDAEGIVQFAVETFGRLDGAVNNVGAGQLGGQRLNDIGTAEWDRVHSITLRGAFFCMRAELNHFLSSGGGVIVNTASIGGVKPLRGQGSYVAAKHGVVGLTKQAAIEYATDNIRVTAVAPSLVATPQFRKVLSPDEQRAYTAIQPAGQPAEPVEIANAIAWLISDEASFVSGDTLLVDGARMQKF